MQIRGIVQATVCAAVLCGTIALGAKADEWNKKTTVTFTDSVEIPGQVLPPGTYVFKLATSPSHRHIVQIWNEDETQILATVLTVPDYRVDAPDKTVIELEERPGNSPMALHSWFYPGDNSGQTFLYHENH